MFNSNLTGAIIGAAIEVHRSLGPGLLESAYEECLCQELMLNNIPFSQAARSPGRWAVLRRGIRRMVL